MNILIEEVVKNIINEIKENHLIDRNGTKWFIFPSKKLLLISKSKGISREELTLILRRLGKKKRRINSKVVDSLLLEESSEEIPSLYSI